MSLFHYNNTPLPIGLPRRMNGNDGAYLLGIYDGANYGDQYADDPEEGVLFESPEAARRWLEAATAALTPYIESVDLSARVPNPEGWQTDEVS